MQETTLTKSRLHSSPILPRFGLLFLLAYVLARGLFIAQLVPPWQGPDEPTHYEYVRLAATERGAPSAFDPSLQAAILNSMHQEGFHAYLGAEPASPPASRFDAEPRLQDAPSQLGSETPLGYLPFMPLADVATGTRADHAISRNLLSMRRISVLLSVAMVFFGFLGLRHALGPALAIPGTALIAFLPMLGFAGSMLNNDPSAAILASVWWWMRMRDLGRGQASDIEHQPGRSASHSIAVLIFVALLAGLAKRTAIYVLPLAILIGLVDGYRRRRPRFPQSISAVDSDGAGADPSRSDGANARPNETSARRPRRFLPTALFSSIVLISLIAFFRPQHDRAAGWDRAGDAWGAERRSDAARTGDWGLRIVDASAARWQYLERWQAIGVDPQPSPEQGDDSVLGPAVSASVWLRDASLSPDGSSSPARAQLVINDDAGGYWGETIELGPDWRELRLSVALSPDASRYRIALVPGDGTVEGMAAFDADDLRLELDGREMALNGGAEDPHRAGSAIPGFLTRYLDPARLTAAASAGLQNPTHAIARAWTGLHFLHLSFWGGFGWLSVWPQGLVYYRLAGAISLFVLVAWAIALVRPWWLLKKNDPQRSSAGSPPTTSASSLPNLDFRLRILRECALASLLAIVIAIAGSMAGAPDRLPQGRYLLAAVFPLAIPTIALAHRLLPRFGPWGLALLVLCLDIYAVAWGLWPAYSTPH